MVGTIVKAALIALHIGSALATCNTAYSTAKPTYKVSTSTTTTTKVVAQPTTITEKSTKTVYQPGYNRTITTTSTSVYVYTFFTANKTTTIPTSSGFVPLASVPGDPAPISSSTTTTTSSKPTRANRRSASPSSSTTLYPISVSCTNTVTVTHKTTVTKYSKTVSEPYKSGTTTQRSTVTTTSSTTISTDVVSTLAVCGPDNVINVFKGSPVDSVMPGYGIDLPCISSGESRYQGCEYTGGANLSPADCCAAVIAINGGSGFVYSGEAPNGNCQNLYNNDNLGWYFNTGTMSADGYPLPQIYAGNTGCWSDAPGGQWSGDSDQRIY